MPPDAETRTWECADRVATEFEAALKRSERPSIRSELERVDTDARERLLSRLVGLEIVYRRQAGEAVGLNDHESAFSELSTLGSTDRAKLVEMIDRARQDNSSSLPTRIGRYPIVAAIARVSRA